ncbi:uncharacterized protein UBRO2_03335 [Ustilago bromivora]|uniref:Uncharacterized protein n=1 Tax=Ustilago bromivora TaxID=307758 RepID=A0A8H8QMU7_9BASI|nr:uncharacterized protein UBRO2_03335 [Ustilago bromivora]
MSLVTLSNHARTERATNRGPDVYPFWDTDLNDLYSRLIPPADSNLTNTSYVPPQGTALHNCWINLIKAIQLITTTVPSLPAPTQPALTHTPVPILTTTPVVPINNFVTHLDLASSIGELHQFLQYKITNAFHKVVGMFPPTQQGKGSHPPHNEHIPLAPPAPAFPARLGEYQASVTYPWLLPDLIDKVHQDTLTAYDLPKLANPSWPGTPAQEDPVVIEGFLVVKAPSTSASNCQFIKAIPNFSMFG